ncbi:MAG: BadF/BadG/BcrA/BcrD ATPase family protein, partial [Chloroflexota bacterium]
MKINAILADEKVSDLRPTTVIGIDIGSRQAKAVLVHGDEIHTTITASGVDSQETAERLIKKIGRQTGILHKDIAYVVGTGYGRIALDFEAFPSDVVTEISCHAMG